MNAFAINRTSQRFESEAPVVLEDFRTRFCYNGTLYNYSTDGGYFESKYAPRPGSGQDSGHIPQGRAYRRQAGLRKTCLAKA